MKTHPTFGGRLRIAAAAFLMAATAGAGAQTPDVHTLARAVDRHYNQLRSLRAGFTESYEGMGMRRTESGTLLLAKPGRMRWDYAQPAGKLFVLDGKYAWFYAKGDPQVQRVPAKQLDDLRSPLRFLLGHTALEKELNNLKATPAAGGLWTLTGVPKGQERRVKRLSVTATTAGAIAAMEIEETDGALTRFRFTDEQDNPALNEGLFHFTPQAGIPVVDALPPV